MAARTQRPSLGALPPRFKFFLNPYLDARFTTSCPGCGGRMKQRKLPLAIHVHDWGMVIMNKTCRFCPGCDLLIAHQDEIESLLAALFERQAPSVIGNKYLVAGTVERGPWRRGLTQPLTPPETIAALHDFRDHVRYQPPQQWVRDEPADRTGKPR